MGSPSSGLPNTCSARAGCRGGGRTADATSTSSRQCVLSTSSSRGHPCSSGRRASSTCESSSASSPKALPRRARLSERSRRSSTRAGLAGAQEGQRVERFESATKLREALVATLDVPVQRRKTAKKRAWSAAAAVLAVGVLGMTDVVSGRLPHGHYAGHRGKWQAADAAPTAAMETTLATTAPGLPRAAWLQTEDSSRDVCTAGAIARRTGRGRRGRAAPRTRAA